MNSWWSNITQKCNQGALQEGTQPMEKRSLGKSSLMLSPIGLGCWQFSKGRGFSGSMWPVLGDDIIRDIVSVSLNGGINWFDTAEIYGRGNSERALKNALQDLSVQPDSIKIADKWFPLLRFAASITRTFGERESNLAPYPIDLYQIHFPGSISFLSSQMERMADLFENQKIKAVGLSNFSAAGMYKAAEALDKRGITLASNQVNYNLLEREIENNGILSAAKELDAAIIAYSPLAQGLLTGKFHEDPGLIKNRPGFRKFSSPFKKKNLERTAPLVHEIELLSKKYSKTPAQIALNWIISFHKEQIFAIPGASTVRHAEQNAAAMDFSLEEEDLRRIDKISRRIHRE
jgi:aryl-alcohol dehydrogenase-like predicted oxidoreductase